MICCTIIPQTVLCVYVYVYVVSFELYGRRHGYFLGHIQSVKLP